MASVIGNTDPQVWKMLGIDIEDKRNEKQENRKISKDKDVKNDYIDDEEKNSNDKKADSGNKGNEIEESKKINNAGIEKINKRQKEQERLKRD